MGLAMEIALAYEKETAKEFELALVIAPAKAPVRGAPRVLVTVLKRGLEKDPRKEHWLVHVKVQVLAPVMSVD